MLTHIRRFLPILLLSTLAACSCPERAEPQPTENLTQMVDRTVDQWLYMQITEESWPILSAEDAGWRQSESLDGVVSWFEDVMAVEMEEEGYWDFSRILLDIKGSEFYEESITDDRLLGFILEAIGKFQYEPDYEGDVE